MPVTWPRIVIKADFTFLLLTRLRRPANYWTGSGAPAAADRTGSVSGSTSVPESAAGRPGILHYPSTVVQYHTTVGWQPTEVPKVSENQP